MTSQQSLKNIAARTAGICLIISLLGFYPAYLGVLHIMCGISQGQVVRYL